MTTRPKPNASRACRVLRVLAASAEPITVAEIGRLTGLHDADARVVVLRAIHEGRVERVGPGRRDGGRDMRPVRITADGRAALDAMLAHRQQPAHRKRLPVVTAKAGYMRAGSGERADDCGRYASCIDVASRYAGNWHCPRDCRQRTAGEHGRATDYAGGYRG